MAGRTKVWRHKHTAKRVGALFFSFLNEKFVLRNIEHIRAGLGEKLDFLIRFIAISATSAIISLVYDWRTSLTIIAVLPLSFGCTFLMSKVNPIFLFFGNGKMKFPIFSILKFAMDFLKLFL